MKQNIIIFMLAALSLASCRTVKYVPVERVRTEYIHSTDTVRETDSIFCEKQTIIREADSATVDNLGLKLKENERAILVLKSELQKSLKEVYEHKRDTVNERDTIKVPILVEKELTWWQETSIKWFPWLLAIVTAMLVILIKPWRWIMRI